MKLFDKAIVFLSIFSASAYTCGSVAAQNAPRITREEYVDKYKHIAIDNMERYGIPASVTIAQGILESDCGNSVLSQKSNNHFGIKCKKNWTGRSVTHDDDAPGECFRAYDCVEDSYEDHARFLNDSPRYDSLFNYAPTDYEHWARGLKAAGYATRVDYADIVIKIINDSQLYLLDGSSDPQSGSTTDSVEEAMEQSSGAQDGQMVDPNDFTVTVNPHKGYNVYLYNGVNYIVAKSGDTPERLSDFFGLSLWSLLSFNDFAKDKTLSQGEIVYIRDKARHWSGEEKVYTAVEGETLDSIAHKLAIHTSGLEKMNRSLVGHTLCGGEVIRIK